MNRVIKFRAWDNKEKCWLMGYEYPNLGGFSMFGECMLFEEWSGILNRFTLQQKDRTPDDLKLMQFTGLLDKNGKEIYEGDIVRRVKMEIEYQTHYGDNIPNGEYTEPCGIIAKYELRQVIFSEGEFTILDPEEDNDGHYNWLRYVENKSREEVNYIFFPHFHAERSQKYSDEDFIETMTDISKDLNISPSTIDDFINLVNGVEVVGNIYEHPHLLNKQP